MYDVVVVGAGSGGLTAARQAASFGARTLLVERLARLGGDCTWYGCVPSKALIRCARARHEALRAADLGVVVKEVHCDWRKVKQHIKACQEQIYTQDDSPEVLEALGVHVRLGCHASFIDSRQMQLKREDGSSEVVSARHFILCTGAGPQIPALKGLEDVPYFTYETIFDLDALPDALCVVGGGPIGCELAQAFSRLGASVTLVGKLLPRESEDVRGVIKDTFKRENIKVLDGRAESVEKVDGGLLLHVGSDVVRASALLLAVGRRPSNLGALQLEKAGVRCGPGGIPVDRKLRSSATHVFAVGDCTGGLQFTHLAGYQGALAAFNALQGLQIKAPVPAAVPRCTFTHPEVASVGLTYEEALAQFGGSTVVRQRGLERVDRAVCEDEQEGFIQLVLVKDRLVGATVVAPCAGEMASELGLAIHRRLPVRALASCVHAYPSYCFALQQMAAEATYEQLRQSRMLACLRCLCGPKLVGNQG